MRKRSGFRWFELILGILLILLGIVTLLKPTFALTGLVILYGILAVVVGIGDVVLFVRLERYTGFGPIVSLISGILSVMSGVMLLVYPNTGRWVLALLFPIWFIAHCISRLTQLHRIRILGGDGRYYFTLVVHVIGLILGFVMLLSPGFTLAVTSYIVSLYLILLGIDSIAMAL